MFEGSSSPIQAPQIKGPGIYTHVLESEVQSGGTRGRLPGLSYSPGQEECSGICAKEWALGVPFTLPFV